MAKGISLESVLTFELTHSPDTLCGADDDDEAHAAIEWDTQKFQFGEKTVLRFGTCCLRHPCHRSTSLDVAAVASVFPHIEAMWQVLLVSTSHIEVLHAGMHNFHPASERGPA